MAAIRASLPARPALGLLAALLANAVALLLFEHSLRLTALALLVVAVAVAASTRPGLVLCAVAAGIIASADLLGLVVHVPQLTFAGFKLQLTDLFLAVGLFAWASWEARRRDARATLAELAREPAFVAFVPLYVLALYDLARGGHGTFSSARIFLYCFVVPLVALTVTTPRRLRLLGGTVAGATAFAALVGVGLVAAGRGVTGADLSTGGLRGISIGGSFLVAGGLLYVLAEIMSGARRPGIGEALLVLVLLGGVVASGARETWLGLFAALAVFSVLSSLRGIVRLALVIGLAGLIAGGVYSVVPKPPKLAATLASVEHRLVSSDPTAAAQDPSVQVRYDKWRVVWNQLRAHPWLGTGFGFPATYTSNIGGNNFIRSYVDDPENTQLWLWARMGTIGFAAWVSFNLLALGTLVVRFARARSPAARTAALWAVGILLVVWSGMVFSPVSAFASTLVLYWLAIALVPVTRTLAELPEEVTA